jgi:hypothetical protein
MEVPDLVLIENLDGSAFELLERGINLAKGARTEEFHWSLLIIARTQISNSERKCQTSF